MAKKIQQTAGARPNKSAFVRSLSFDMPSADVIARARAKGMLLTRNDVHAIRAIARRKRASGARPAGAGRGRSSGGVNKSAFVRSLPASLSAAEVIEKGKAKGIKLSAAQVYTIRANARRKAPDREAPRALRASHARGSSSGGRRADAKEAEFIAAALDLGLARAEALIRTLRAKASAGWS
jgi:hypothetical protein